VEVKQGEIVGLLGPNGAGKTTTFYMVVGLIRPDQGDVYLNEVNITRLPMYKRAQMGIGYLPQEASVFRKLTVEDNILAVLEMTKLTKQEQKNKLEALLDEFNLHEVRKNNGDSLSGGERRRTEIARALAVDPKFILLDEPFAGVDPIAVEDIQAVVAKLKYRNIGILITDHNVNETLSICDRAYLLIGGKIFIHGTAEELAANEQVRRLYLGTNFVLRRKDWILEGERDNQKAGPVRKEIKSDSLQNFIRYTNTRNQELIKHLDNYGPFKGQLAIIQEFPFKDFLQTVAEVKVALLQKASAVHDNELKTTAEAIPDIEYKNYASIFDYSHLKQTIPLLGGVFRLVYYAMYYSKLSALEDKLHQLKSTLGQADLLVNAYGLETE
jgi:lipopolysaccharide export system ATP-binding protein